VHSFLIANLAIGDFFMGVYLMIIALVDTYYRGVVRFATKNIHRYDKNIKRNDTKFNTRNTNTEYSQPPTWSGVI
jgi:hypothetical protein